jgi:glycosyltransferase involved in cell wall biosynthesis
VPTFEPDSRPGLSVVIPTLNGERFLAAQLEALARQVVDRSFEVLVADNGSSDATVSIARTFAGRMRLEVVDASRGSGQTVARNAGAAAARAPLLIFLDQDDEVAPGYLQAMAHALDRCPAVAARMDVDALNPGWIRELRDVTQTSTLPRQPHLWAYGCTLGMHAELFAAVGGFDEGLSRPGAEDIELCGRIDQADVELRFVPDAVLRYRFPDHLSAVFAQGRRYGIGQALADARYPERSEPMPFSVWWRGLLGATRLVVVGPTRGKRGRGLFVLGRRLGLLEGKVRALLGGTGPRPTSPAADGSRRNTHG